MKKLFAVIVMTFIVIAVSAQQQKGDFQLQGQVSYTSTTISGTTTSYSMIQISASQFITDQIEVGVAPLMMLGKDFGTTQLALFSNYSFVTSDAKLVPYAGLQLQLNSLKYQGVDAQGNPSTTTKTSFGFGVRAGIRYFISERVNIDVGPKYSVGDQTNFIFSVGVGVLLGKR